MHGLLFGGQHQRGGVAGAAVVVAMLGLRAMRVWGRVGRRGQSRDRRRR